MSAVALVDEVTETIRALDEAAARWAGDHDRGAASEAITAIDDSIALLRRAREELTQEIRDYDEHHRPYDSRD